jgi:IS1 family transposase
MKKNCQCLLGFWLIFLFFWTFFTPVVPDVQCRCYFEQQLPDNRLDVLNLFGFSACPIWIRTKIPRRKQRPYRNPLRKLRKQIRALKRELQRLKKKQLREQAGKDDSSDEQAANNIVQSIQDTEEKYDLEQRKFGRPATIITNHFFCTTDGCRGFHITGPHLDHWIVGCGTYSACGETRQLLQCKWCGAKFSETRNTVFFGLNTPSKTIYLALACLAENMGIRATSRVFGVKKETVLLWLRRAGEHCTIVSDYLMRNLQVEQAQLDELWTFIVKKEKNLTAWEKLHTEYGDTWIWTAVDPIHKLVLAHHVGGHELSDAQGLLKKLKAVLADGCIPLFTSDELPHYTQAILGVFGRLVQPARKGNRGRFPKPRMVPTEDMLYATVNKKRKGGYIVSITQRVVFGVAKKLMARLAKQGMTINTSFVERMNLTLRHLVSRLRRKGLTFSKKQQYLEWHLQLSIAYYHFVLTHLSLRRLLPEPLPTKGTGSLKKWENRTPAMSAGITTHKWTMYDLLTCRVPLIHDAGLRPP